MTIPQIKIRDLRKERELSQDELAQMLGVSRQTIFAIETGRSEPSLTLALKLCALLEAEIEELFFFPELQISETNKRKEVPAMTNNLLPWSPLGELSDLHREIDRFFEGTVSSKQALHFGAMNVKDAGDKFVVEITVPGFNEDEIDIQVGDDYLTVKGEHKEEKNQENENYLKREFSHGSFERSIMLPTDIKTDAIQANTQNGTLEIILPKVEPVKPKITKVKVTKK